MGQPFMISREEFVLQFCLLEKARRFGAIGSLCSLPKIFLFLAGEERLEVLGPVLFPTGQQIEESAIHVLRFLRRRLISLTRMARTNSETLS